MVLKAAIFDLDGLLVNSEPLWRVAEYEAFRSVGIELTPDNCGETIGLRTDEVVAHWFAKYPWDPAATSLEELERHIEGLVIDQLREKSPARPGVEHALEFFERQGLGLAVASSSPLSIIHAGLEALGIGNRFVALCSAEIEKRGKPDPAVYLTAARKLGTPPDMCLALEDSLVGLAAAQAAGMRCVLVPDESLREGAPDTRADVVLNSLADLNDDVWARFSEG